MVPEGERFEHHGKALPTMLTVSSRFCCVLHVDFIERILHLLAKYLNLGLLPGTVVEQ